MSYERGTPVKDQKDDSVGSDAEGREYEALDQLGQDEPWLQRHPEAGSSWPSWPQAS